MWPVISTYRWTTDSVRNGLTVLSDQGLIAAPQKSSTYSK